VTPTVPGRGARLAVLAIALAAALPAFPGPSSLPARSGAPGSFSPLPSRERGERERVKGVVLVIGDGMSRAAEIAASRFLHGRDDALAWHGPEFAYRGFASTWDVTTYDRHAQALGQAPYAPGTFIPGVGYDPSKGGPAPWPLSRAEGQDRYLLRELPLRGGAARVPATDSAAAATALATGVKTDAGNLAWAPGDAKGGALDTIAERARRERCAAIGVVTTVPFSHATPAAFLAHSTRRDAYDEIARQMLAARPEVIVGGGSPRSSRRQPGEAERWVDPDDYAAARRPGSGWTVVDRAREPGGPALLRAAAELPPGQRLLALFGGPGGAFEPAVPAADGSASVRIGDAENPSLADAATAALTVLARDPDGFFLVVEQGDVDWAIHAGDYAWLVGAVWDLDQAVRAIAAFVERPGDDLTWENTLVVVTADHANGHLRLGPPRGKGVLPRRGDGGYTFGAAGSDHPAGHTNELVTLAARGAGAKALFSEVEGRWYPGTAIVDHTQVHGVMLRALGLEAAPGAAASCP
jgi:alkaline phosphatase